MGCRYSNRVAKRALLSLLVSLCLLQYYSCGFTVISAAPTPVPAHISWLSKPILMHPSHQNSQSLSSVDERRATDSNENNNLLTPLMEFVQSAAAGALSCSLTHSIIVPLDVVKTKMQTNPLFASMSILQATKAIISSGGMGSLFRGLTATTSGYLLQGACKFGFYEFFKSYFNRRSVRAAEKYKLPILIFSSGLAETFASWALCPLEVTKIYMVSNPDVARSLPHAMSTILKAEGIRGLYKGINWILLRQIPYTCVKLVGYDMIAGALRRQVEQFKQSGNPDQKARMELSHKQLDTMIQISSGVIAGVLAAIISQPADVLLSKICGASLASNGLTECIIVEGPSTLFGLMAELGWKGCYQGIKPRAIMVGSVTALQFLMYENAKKYIKSATSPSSNISGQSESNLVCRT